MVERLDKPGQGRLEPFLRDVEVGGGVGVSADRAAAVTGRRPGVGLVGHVAVQRLVRGALEPVGGHVVLLGWPVALRIRSR